MTNSDPGNNHYQREFDAAVEMFDEGNLDKCTAQGRKNLTDHSLPPFYFIKNCILIACALDDWEDADIYRRGAEQCYTKTMKRAMDAQDQDALECLQDLREELDELKGFRDEDLGALGSEDTMNWDAEEGEEEGEEEENWSENEEDAADTEDKPEKAAET